MVKLAEEKKQRMRREVNALRKVFRRLRQRGAQLPADLRLSEREFVMDPHLEEGLRQRAGERVAEVQRQATWDSKKHSIALSKLQQRSEDTREVGGADCHVLKWPS